MTVGGKFISYKVTSLRRDATTRYSHITLLRARNLVSLTSSAEFLLDSTPHYIPHCE